MLELCEEEETGPLTHAMNKIPDIVKVNYVAIQWSCYKLLYYNLRVGKTPPLKEIIELDRSKNSVPQNTPLSKQNGKLHNGKRYVSYILTEHSSKMYNSYKSIEKRQ